MPITTQPWYTAPTALAIIARMERPEVLWTECRYPLTIDRFAKFVGADVDALEAIQDAHFDATHELLKPYPQEVIGALFGDAYGNEYHRTFDDHSEEWATIRANVAAAMPERLAA